MYAASGEPSLRECIWLPAARYGESRTVSVESRGILNRRSGRRCRFCPTTLFKRDFKRRSRGSSPRYFASDSEVGISLTGGLDTRMIMAVPGLGRSTPRLLYFCGTKEERDARIASQVAKVSGLDHQLIRIEIGFPDEVRCALLIGRFRSPMAVLVSGRARDLFESACPPVGSGPPHRKLRERNTSEHVHPQAVESCDRSSFIPISVPHSSVSAALGEAGTSGHVCGVSGDSLESVREPGSRPLAGHLSDALSRQRNRRPGFSSRPGPCVSRRLPRCVFFSTPARP